MLQEDAESVTARLRQVGIKCFSSDGPQNYLLFIATWRTYWMSNDENRRRIELLGSTWMSQKVLKICRLQTLLLLQN